MHLRSQDPRTSTTGGGRARARIVNPVLFQSVEHCHRMLHRNVEATNPCRQIPVMVANAFVRSPKHCQPGNPTYSEAPAEVTSATIVSWRNSSERVSNHDAFRSPKAALSSGGWPGYQR